jgi:UDP-N-acetylglucosamine 1-carboxyvinyltransferase
MDCFHIRGRRPLQGTVAVGGSKNAALPIMAASILAESPVTLWGVPRLADVDTLARTLGQLGIRVARQDDGSLKLETVDSEPTTAPYDLVRRMRASFCVLGPLLARRQAARVSLPGGCNIGTRPVGMHLAGLAALGADIRIEHGYVVARAKRLKGTHVPLRGPFGPTVTGTANVLAAATRAQGVTTISGAATEPEIVDLGRFLISLGAEISGLGTDSLRIVGVERMGGASHRVIPDRIEAATLLIAVAITGGEAAVTGLVPHHLDAVLGMLEHTGARLAIGTDCVHLMASGRPRAATVAALPFPGIPSDVQAQLTALLALAEGTSTIRDCVFPERFMQVAELNRLGSRIERRPGVAIVHGVERLSGADVMASDLRASAALVIAGLAAHDETIVRRIYHLDRGYERLEKKLAKLGACIERRRDASTSRLADTADCEPTESIRALVD